MDHWKYIYRVELYNLFNIFQQTLFKSSIDFNKHINFNTFCYLIYKQSSGKIGKYDQEISDDRERLYRGMR